MFKLSVLNLVHFTLWLRPFLWGGVLLLGSPSTFASELPGARLYGQFDVGARYSKTGGDGGWHVDSRGSYIGVVGDFKHSEDVSVIYQLEYEVDLDGDSNDTFVRNDSFLGVQSHLGTLRAGVMETPLRHLANAVDLFSDTLGDPSELWNGDIRTSDTLYYQTPVSSLIRAEVALVASENGDTAAGEERRDGYSAALWLERDGAGIAVAAERHIEANDLSRQRIAAHWTAGVVRLGAAVERESRPAQSSALAKIASVALDMGQWLVKTQYGKSDIQQRSEYLGSIGVDFLLQERLTVYTNLHRHQASTVADFVSLEAGVRFAL